MHNSIILSLILSVSFIFFNSCSESKFNAQNDKKEVEIVETGTTPTEGNVVVEQVVEEKCPVGKTKVIPSVAGNLYKELSQKYKDETDKSMPSFDTTSIASEIETRRYICKLWGFDEVESYDNTESKPDSKGRYRKNYTSPHNNHHIKWNGTSFVRISAEDYEWVHKITCVCE